MSPTVRSVERDVEIPAPGLDTLRVSVLGAAFLNDNLGVGALAAGTVTSLLEALPGVAISLLNYSRKPDVHEFRWRGRAVPIPTVRLRMKLELVHNVFILLALALVWRLLPGWRARQWWAERNPVLQHIAACDAALSIAGGDSFSDIYGVRVLFNVALPQVLVLLMRKRLVQLPQTIGPFETRIGRWIGSFLLMSSDMIFTRDQMSIEAMRMLPGGASLAARTSFCYDVGFLVEPQPAPTVLVEGLALDGEPQGPLVGINISGLLFAGGEGGNDAFGCQATYVAFCHRMMDLFLEEKGARVLLIPHVHGESKTKDTGVCLEVYRESAERWPGRVGFAGGRYATAEIKPVMAQCDFLVAARMHACIGALSMGVPAVGVAYSRKFKGVYESLGIPELVIDPRTMGVEEMVASLAESFDRRSKIAADLAEKMPGVKRSIVERIGAAVICGPVRS